MEETSWKFYLTASETWEAMLEDCARATTCIDFEQYILSNDEIGRKFFEVFLNKVKEGVKVRLLCDSAGSYNFYNSSHAKALRKAGVEIRFFNQISPWRLKNFTSLFFRDHRKILIIDAKIGYTGGVGIEKVMANWRDTHVRVEGPIVHEMQYVFSRMWQIVEYGVFLKFRFPPSIPGTFRFFTVSPHFRQRFFYRRLINKIRSAKKYIYLTTPYFVPNQRFFINLMRAAKRGVEIRLIVPKNSDHPFVDAAGRSYFGLALGAGIKIYLYKNNVMHAKTAIIDDNWASVGSANLDNMSMLLNYEANLVSENHQFIGQLKDHFVNDLMSASELSLDEWQNRSIFQKIFELITWPFHSLL